MSRYRAIEGVRDLKVSSHDGAAVLALSEVRGVGQPHHLAQLLEEAGGVQPLLSGEGSEELIDPAAAEAYAERVDRSRIPYWEAELDQLAREGIQLVTVCDSHYPVNLRLVFNRPPFLFVWGDLEDVDQHSVAVVGTRKPSHAGTRLAGKISTGLVEHGLTVVSGLALGIDVAAHAAAINAGGRTLAVLGSGITHISPTSHRAIARQIRTSGRGALLSQFPPALPPQKWTFPMRNVVMSGLSTGTVVVEAGETSGARIQAEKCLEHGKRLFLVEPLVTHQKWAQELADKPGASVVSTAEEIITQVCHDLSIPREISIAT